MNTSTRNILDRSFTALAYASLAAMAAAVILFLAPIVYNGIGAVVFNATVEHEKFLRENLDAELSDSQAARIASADNARKPLYAMMAEYEKSAGAAALAERLDAVFDSSVKSMGGYSDKIFAALELGGAARAEALRRVSLDFWKPYLDALGAAVDKSASDGTSIALVEILRRQGERLGGVSRAEIAELSKIKKLGFSQKSALRRNIGEIVSEKIAASIERLETQNRAYETFRAGVAELLGALLKKDRDGFLKLPLSSSPEIHDMELEAFLTPNSNFDQALLLRFYADLAELADAAGKSPLAKKALQMRSRLAPLAVDPKEGLLIAPGELLKESHRHHSHLMGIWPLKLMTMEHDAATIANSLGRIDFLGTGQWVGYSFGWQAALNAWCGRGDRAIRLLNKFIDSFVSRNGFHLNGDFQDHGDSSFKYRPFTLEGNFVAMQAIHEMLLHAEAGVIRLFPALPEEWRKVSFEALRAPGGIRVSATLRGGVLLQAELFSPVEQDIWFSAPGVKEKRVRLSAGRAWHWFNRTAHPAGGTEDFAFDDSEDVSNG